MNETTIPDFWKKCSSCKNPIGFSTKYYLCSVSTCRHSRKAFTFCSPSCWSEHLGFMNHREAWAEDYQSPTKSEVGEVKSIKTSSTPSSTQANTPTTTPTQGRRIIVDKKEGGQTVGANSFSKEANEISTDTLIVVSKVKKLIKEQSGMSTSQCCVDALTKKVISECLSAIKEANLAERKTVMGRDVK